MPKKALSPRKDSKQTRSQNTVEAILQAATQILAKIDLDKTTTNKIAEMAGVSIGSYYQYFPNKESLVAKLIDREVTKYTAQLETMFDEHADDEWPALVEVIVGDLCDQFFGRKALARIFIKSAGFLKKTDVVIEARSRIAKRLTQLISDRRPERPWTDLKSFVLVNATMGVLYSYALGQREEPDSALRLELVTMVLNYIN